MAFQAGARIHSEEILDAGTAAPQEVQESLGDLRRLNAWLGGRRVLRTLLREQVRRTNLARFTVLDAGTGSGDLAAYVARNFPAWVCGLDRQPLHLQLAEHDRAWSPVAADMHAMPFPVRSFDFVTASLVLHHFEDDAAVKLLREMAALARHALLVNDLERHVLPWWFIRYSPFASNHITRLDGAASVQRAFTVDELTALAQRAGFTRFRVRKHIPFRLSLVIEL
jgi:ubiquinone/menaquinone biosynthesis C-methylase UbiE